MAIRLLPFRQYAEEDVVNLYSMDAANDQVDTAQGDGDAGIFVKHSFAICDFRFQCECPAAIPARVRNLMPRRGSACARRCV